MGKRWTPSEDESLQLLYTVGESWAAIAKAFDVTLMSAKAHGAKLGLNWRDGPRPLRQSTDTATEPGVRLRPPLPAGHPISWSLVTALTPCIWGRAYDRQR